MYAVSADFHAAILAGAKQKALLKFADTIFTNSDIAMQGGLALTEPFCAQEELTIGLCPSAFLTASLLNEGGQLDTFTFGEFKAYLGVMVDSNTYTPEEDANASLMIGADVYSVHDDVPYVRLNGTGLDGQPPFAPQAMIVLDGALYIISSAGAYYRYYANGLTHADMALLTHTQLAEFTHAELAGDTNIFVPYAMDDVMVHKGVEWAANNSAIVFEDAAMTVYSMDGTYEVYEMCPLGVFNAERPATVRQIVVKFTAYDNMSLTDVDVTSWFAALTYPKTLGAMYAALCTELGITTTTTTFINSTHSYASAPFTSNSLTGRQLLKYIAEAACAIARCDRDGNLLLDWFAAETHTISQLTGITIAEYDVAAIDKLQVQAETTDIGAIIGTGTNAYVLLASPLIVGETAEALEAFATDISTRLFAYPVFTPISAKMPADWSLESGDIIDVVYETITYSLPIYSQTLTWNGTCKATLNSTGKPLRDVNSVTNREEFISSQARTLIEKTINGIAITVSGKVGADEIVAKINLSAEELKIDVDKITLEGLVTANTYFKILEDGSMEAINGKFTGTTKVVNPSNSNQQIIIGENADGDFGGFITRDGGATFIRWLDFDGLDGTAITPGSFDPLAVPTFTYTGSYVSVSDGTAGWRIKFLTSGTFTPTDNMTVDAFLVGGGGGNNYGGGGGGYTLTHSSIALTGGTGYPIVVGAGGASEADGAASTGFTYTANGGHYGLEFNGGAGGSGGGASSGNYEVAGGSGGSNGTNGGTTGSGSGGAGQGTTTKEFGETTGDLYGGGGGGYDGGSGGTGGGGTSVNGTANTGGGAGGSNFARSGGSGIVIIRNHRA
jgi:hypothetical protein